MGQLHPLTIRTLPPGRYSDGGGLWLQVKLGSASWLFRYMLNGRARAMGLGALTEVGLAEARTLAEAARLVVHAGRDPIAERRRAQTALITFRAVADHYLAAHEPAWKNAKHRYQWRATLDLACVRLGNVPVSQVDTHAVLQVLRPMWARTPETASRLRGRIEAILNYAKTLEWRSGDNPAAWRGHIQNVLPPANRVRPVVHQAAMRWRDVPIFMPRLRAERGMAARALEWVILTACRPGEARFATWAELDLDQRIWNLAPDETKQRRAHRVPLSEAALAVLRRVQPDAPDHDPNALVFPARYGALSDMAMNMLLRRIVPAHVTAHGFRSAFRDWCAEATPHAREVAEKALGHQLGAVEGAYQRGDMLAKRRVLMDDWAAFLSGGSPSV